MFKEMYNMMDIKCPEKLVFIGSGLTKTPKEWHGIDSIRVNTRTLGLYLENPIYGIMTWPTPTYEGLGGVVKSKWYVDQKEKPYIFLFDQKSNPVTPFYNEPKNMFHYGIAGKYSDPMMKDYIKYTDECGFTRWNSTGLYLCIWLLYSDAKEIFISGYDGHMGFTKAGEKKWDTERVYQDILGNEWCPADNKALRNNSDDSRTKNFQYHNLDNEWKAIVDAIAVARKNGKKITVSTDYPQGE
jgi:hypothetical protein